MQDHNKKIDFFRLGREDINPIIIGVVGSTGLQKANFPKELIHLLDEHENVVALNREYQHNKKISEQFDEISNDIAIVGEKLNKSLSDCIGAINAISYNFYSTTPTKNREGSKEGHYHNAVTKRRSKSKQAKKSRRKNKK